MVPLGLWHMYNSQFLTVESWYECAELLSAALLWPVLVGGDAPPEAFHQRWVRAGAHRVKYSVVEIYFSSLDPSCRREAHNEVNIDVKLISAFLKNRLGWAMQNKTRGKCHLSSPWDSFSESWLERNLTKVAAGLQKYCDILKNKEISWLGSLVVRVMVLCLVPVGALPFGPRNYFCRVDSLIIIWHHDITSRLVKTRLLIS